MKNKSQLKIINYIKNGDDFINHKFIGKSHNIAKSFKKEDLLYMSLNTNENTTKSFLFKSKFYKVKQCTLFG